MLSTTGNIERAGSTEKIQPQMNAKADANRSGTVDKGESISTHLRWFAFICGKVIPNGRIGSMWSVFRHCCTHRTGLTGFFVVKSACRVW